MARRGGGFNTLALRGTVGRQVVTSDYAGEITGSCKLQTHPLVTEGAPHQHPRSYLTVLKTWCWSPDGCLTPRQTGRLTVRRNITLIRAWIVLSLRLVLSEGPNRAGGSLPSHEDGHRGKEWRLLGCVALVRTDISEELSASVIRVTRIGELGTTLAVTSNRRTLRRNTSETSVLARATRCNIPEDAILHSHRRENHKSYTDTDTVCEALCFPVFRMLDDGHSPESQ
jgi:hypothetical protein